MSCLGVTSKKGKYDQHEADDHIDSDVGSPACHLNNSTLKPFGRPRMIQQPLPWPNRGSEFTRDALGIGRFTLLRRHEFGRGVQVGAELMQRFPVRFNEGRLRVMGLEILQLLDRLLMFAALDVDARQV